MRLTMAKIFFYSGLTKIQSWSTTVSLFKYEYKTPFLPPEIAATMATAAELTCPILLILGLGTRFAALPMLAMTAIIQFTYLEHIEHLYWTILLCTLIFYGPGRLSVDYYIKKKLENCGEETETT